jgi:hypothetical protein
VIQEMILINLIKLIFITLTVILLMALHQIYCQKHKGVRDYNPSYPLGDEISQEN